MLSRPDAALPPLVTPPESVEVLPCGVVKLKGVLTPEAQQRLWDIVVCAGFDYRAIRGENQGANMWYTGTAGAPDILLHYNYYEPPCGTKQTGLRRSRPNDGEQPPPMAILCAADAIFRAVSQHECSHSFVGKDVEMRSNGAPHGHEGRGSASAASQDGEAATKRARAEWASELAAAGLSEYDDWVEEDGETALARQAFEEKQRLRWPCRPNFRSVLAIGYKPDDSFKWHTDLAGEDGWVCSLSVGATATFEYLPTVAPSAARRAKAHATEVPVQVHIESGDCVLFNGGLLPHRIACVEPMSEEHSQSGLQAQIAPYVRFNLQVRVYGAGEAYGLQELLARGYDYVH